LLILERTAGIAARVTDAETDEMNERVEVRPPAHHATDAAIVLEALGSHPGGLSSEDAAARLERHGPNRLPDEKRRGPLVRFLAHFDNILIYVLLASAAITAALAHWVDTAVILAVVVVNAIIGFIQEGRAEKAMESIRAMLAPAASVMRDGIRRTVPGEELVPGDIVLLEAGDRVPADLRLTRVAGLKVEEAVLTGESVPVEKSVAAVNAEAPLGDRTSMAFSGTLVTAGTARGVVVATGARTEIGRISGMLSEVEQLTTPLVRQMDVFAKWLTVLILLVAGLLLLYGTFVAHYDFADMFIAVVALSVAAIPAGLPAVMTITLAVGVSAMARRNAIVRRLPAIETLGSVSVICTDKTGTLTRNEMMVASVAVAGDLFSLEGGGYAPHGAVCLDGKAVNGRDHVVLEELGRAALLCNDAALHHHEGEWRVEGDPMEGALRALAGKVGLDMEEEARCPRVGDIPFDSRHRFMATLHHAADGSAFVFVKGAPEVVFGMCAEERTREGGTAPLEIARWQEEAHEIAAEGQRVLALATRRMPAGTASIDFPDVEFGLVLVGLVGLMDPPRPEAIDAVAECHQAGIEVKMITGDHAGTAAAIGKQIGLSRTSRVLTGAEIDAMEDAELVEAVRETDVFARTSPAHKLRLVTALQSRGLTVAMTGDGVNDAPALKRADAGVAMGRKGSEAAKEASELVLADDNFASIAAAVREGRTVYDNIKKVVSWTLPTNGGESFTLLAALLFGMALPVTPIQILWVNLVTAVTLGIALAYEPTEENTMRRPPRPREEPLLGAGLAWQIVFVSALFAAGVFGIYAYAVDAGHSEALARTLALNTLVVMEIFYLFFIRNIYGTSLTWQAVKGTPIVWATVAAVVVAQFAITYLPPLQAVFGTEAVPIFDGVVVVALGAAMLAIVETEKQVRLAVARLRPAGAT